MKFIFIAATLGLASCATTPFRNSTFVWPKDSAQNPAATQTNISLSSTQTTPNTATITTSIIQRGFPRPQNISIPVQAQIQNIQLTWINSSRFFITDGTNTLIDYQKQSTNVWYANPIQNITR